MSRSFGVRVASIIATVALVVLFATACGSGDDAPSTQKVSFELIDTGCEPFSAETAAGHNVFVIKNVAAPETNEFKVLDGDKILGEVENLSKGHSDSIPLNLKEGSYTLRCSGPNVQRGKLSVSKPKVFSGSDAEVAVEEYRAYLERASAELAEAVSHMAHKIAIHSAGSAGSRYSYARVLYSQIEPVAESFGNLDRRINGLAGEVPASEFSGFHRIEKALWAEETTAGMTPVAKQLVADVEELQRKMKTVELQPVPIANDASTLLDEVSSSKIAGKEERYAETDLIDISANVEGAEAAFEAVKPVLEEKDSDLTGEIEEQFKAVYAALGEYGHPARQPGQPWPTEPGIGFIAYELPKTAVRKFAQPFDALAELFSQVPAGLAG